MGTGNKSFVKTTLILSSLLVIGVCLLAAFSNSRVSYAKHDVPSETVQQALIHAESLSDAFQYVAEAVRPSVVSIRTVQQTGLGMRSSPQIPNDLRRFFGNDDRFEKFFFEFGAPNGQRKQQGLGSGVIISTDGYVLTNNHVVGRSEEVTVTLADGRAFAAKVVGTDKKTDLAVLQINASDLTAVPLGDSDTVNVGEWILAIGSPFNYHQTVTAGIVSAKGRTVGVADYEDFIQTDAAINPGNSGGPLVNLRGEVIGINTAIASRSGGFNGLGFSIPSNMVRTITNAIVKHGRVQRGKLGVVVQNLNDELAKSFQFDAGDGVLIGDVQPGSPAEQAGLLAGDIVTRLNDSPVKHVNALRNLVASMVPGTHVALTIHRNGNPLTLQLVLDELEDHPLPTIQQEKESSDPLGLNLETLTPEHSRQLQMDPHLQGVIVTDIIPGGIADQASLHRGDLIVSVENQPVHSIDDFWKVMKTHDLEQGVRLRVVTDGVGRFAVLQSNP